MVAIARERIYQREAQRRMAFDWERIARPEQLPPGDDWRFWLLLAGRGFGKTRTGAEWVRAQVAAGKTRIALVAPTAADARDVMIEGKAGLMNIHPPNERPFYEPSKRRVTWPNGAIATAFSADEPDRLRGPEHDAAWCDELAAWRYPMAWDMLMLGLRGGNDPRCVVTTTPRPIKIIRELIADEHCSVTSGSTFDNAANLAPAFLQHITAKYEGTRLGRQELYAEMLDDVPGALWLRAWLDDKRCIAGMPDRPVVPDMERIVVAIDPATTGNKDSDETGIIVAGLGIDGRGYVLADISMRGRPNQWALKAVEAYHQWGADRIVAEVNQGGDMVEDIIRQVDQNVSYKAVHASKGKITRAEPIAALYEQGRISHVGSFPILEDQLCSYTGNEGSPDRLDAAVWALTELITNARQMHFTTRGANGEIETMRI